MKRTIETMIIMSVGTAVYGGVYYVFGVPKPWFGALGFLTSFLSCILLRLEQALDKLNDKSK